MTKARNWQEIASGSILTGVKCGDYGMFQVSGNWGPSPLVDRFSTNVPAMETRHTIGIGLLIATIFAGGCVLAVRKGVGTLQGPNGSMTVTADNGGVAQGERIGSIDVREQDGVGVPDHNFQLVLAAVKQALEEQDLYSRATGDLELSLNITRYVNRPGKKVLDITVTLTRGDSIVGTATMSANLNGFGSSEEVAKAIGKATIAFINNINNN